MIKSSSRSGLSPATLADLAKSGLTLHDARKLQIRDVSIEEMLEFGGKQCAGYALPYFDQRGQFIGFERYKYLIPESQLQDWLKDKWLKYHQVASTDNHFYLPRLALPRKQSWAQILQDPKVLLAFTEGEKKAAKAVKSGLLTIGLSGIWGWVSRGRIPIHDFKLVNFKDREVALIFDSDARSNSIANVDMAMTALAGEIIRRGGRPFRIRLLEEF
jgi:hypothetical protein